MENAGLGDDPTCTLKFYHQQSPKPTHQEMRHRVVFGVPEEIFRTHRYQHAW